MITKQDIKKLSELARIEVSDAETDNLQKDLERILMYAEQLNRAEFGTVEPVANMSFQKNVFRDDTEEYAVESDTPGLVEVAPYTEKGFIKVQPVWKR